MWWVFPFDDVKLGFATELCNKYFKLILNIKNLIN